MYRIIGKPVIEQINPNRAERLLNYNHFDGQRVLRPKLINHYANKMREGLFRTCEIAIAKLNYANGQGEYVLPNGQHQLNAIIQANVCLMAKIETYECDTPDDLSLLYMQFDTSGSRSLSDLVRMEVVALEVDWPFRIAKLVVSSAAIKENMVQSTKEEKAALLKDYLKTGAFINHILNETVPKDVIKAKHTAHLTRSPVGYSMLVTWDKHQGDSQTFWLNVRDGKGLKRSMPEYKLRDFLKTVNFDKGRGASNLKTVGHHEMASKCITAWNAFRKGGPTKLQYFPAKPIPKAI